MAALSHRPTPSATCPSSGEMPGFRRRTLRNLGWGVVASLALLTAGCGDGGSGSDRQAAIHVTTSAAYTEQGQYRAAMIEARNAIKQAPNDIAGPLQLARVYLALGNYRGAADILEQLPENSSAEVRIALADAYVNLGKYRSAIEILSAPALRDAVAESSDAQITLAEAQAGQGDHRQAVQSLRDIIQRQPDAGDAYISLARVYLVQQDTMSANETLEQLLSRNPHHPEAQLLLALQARASNDLESADRHLSTALSGLPQTDIMTPLKSQILSALADTLTQLGRPAEALVYTRLLAEADPEASESRKQFNQALNLYQAGNIEEAEKILTQLNEKNPGHAYSAMLLGLVNFQQGDYEQAGQLLGDNVDPETSTPQLLLATAIAQMPRSPDAALALVEQSLSYHPDHVGLNAFYGTALLREPETEQVGLDALNKAIRLAPEQARLRLPLANHHYQNGRFDRAREEFRTAARLAPADPPVQSAWVEFLVKQEQFTEAQQAAEQFVKAAPENASSHLLAGRVYTQSQQLAPARNHFKHAQQLAPENLLGHLGLGQVELMDRNSAAAEAVFRKAITLSPTDPRPYMGLVTTLEMQQRNREVASSLEQLAAQEDNEGTALAVLAQYQLRNGDLDSAIQSIERAQPGSSASGYVNNTAAAIYRNSTQRHLAAGRLDDAQQAGNAALQIKPDDSQIVADLANIAIAAERYDDAQGLLAHLRQLPDGEPAATLLGARQAVRQKNPDQARKLLEQRWQAQREPAIADNLYGLLMQSGDTQAADRLLQDWNGLHPQDPRPLTHRAMVAQQQGRTDDAVSYYQQALQLAPNSAVLLNNLAWLYFENGNEQALELASRAADAAPDNAAILDTYGWILTQQGQVEKGVEVLQRAAKLDPEHEEIRQHLKAAEAML